METTTTSIFYNFEYSTYVMFHFLTHLTPSMYEDQYVKMKKLLTVLEIVVFTYFENIYSTPDHVTSVRERILSVSVVLLCICAYLLVLIRLKYTRFSNALLEVRRVKIILNVTANFVRVFGSYSRLVFKDQIFR